MDLTVIIPIRDRRAIPCATLARLRKERRDNPRAGLRLGGTLARVARRDARAQMSAEHAPPATDSPTGVRAAF